MEVKTILEQRWVIPTAVGVVGVATGFTAGYFLGRRNGECIVYEVGDRFETDNSDEEDDVDIPVDVVSSLVENDPAFEVLLEDEGVSAGEDFVKKKLLNDVANAITDEEVSVTEDVFDEPAIANIFDASAEEEKKVGGEPYIITVEAYAENVNDWTQETLNYYAGDDIVTTQDNTPIYNHSDILGELNFGYGSHNQDSVYIRNEKMRMEWEVLRTNGRYEIEVLGHTIEQEYESSDLKHSMDRKFRDD